MATDRSAPNTESPRQHAATTGRFSGLRIVLLTTPSPRGQTESLQFAPPRMVLLWRSYPITAAGPRWILTTFPCVAPACDTGHRVLFNCQNRQPGQQRCGIDLRWHIPATRRTVKKNLSGDAQASRQRVRYASTEASRPSASDSTREVTTTPRERRSLSTCLEHAPRGARGAPAEKRPARPNRHGRACARR